MNPWQHVLSDPPPPNVPVVVSDGTVWRKATRQITGRYRFDGTDTIQPVYWSEVLPAPRPAYTDASGATIIQLSGLTLDIHLVAQPGDELWTTALNDFSDGKQPYLIFEECLPCAVSLRHYRGGFVAFYDWDGFRRLLPSLGVNSSYLRRPAPTK